MNRIEHNIITGETTVVQLTPEEEADAQARTAAEAADPDRLGRIAQAQLRAEAKATAMFAVLQSATLEQIDKWVDTNFAGMTAQQRSLLKLLAAVAGMYLRER